MSVYSCTSASRTRQASSRSYLGVGTTLDIRGTALHISDRRRTGVARREKSVGSRSH